VAGPVTLPGLRLANQNATKDIPRIGVRHRDSNPAPIVSRADRRESGLANAFTVQNALTGKHGGIYGRRVEAQNAEAKINNIPVTSTDNVLSSAIPGVTVTLVSEAPTQTVAVTFERERRSLSTRIEAS
jgi:hypothetical protein